jgi:F-type H+-transporting ATPase subunit c
MGGGRVFLTGFLPEKTPQIIGAPPPEKGGSGMRKLFHSAMLAGIFILTSGSLAMAAEAASGGSDHKWAVALAAGLCVSVAAAAGAIGQGRATAAALKGIARNPGAQGKIFTPMILGLALIESLVIYSLIISFILVFKV